MTADIKWDGGDRAGSVRRAVEWTCQGCGCREVWDDRRSDNGARTTPESCIWDCSCRCHDGWKFAQDGGRYRSQMDRLHPHDDSGGVVFPGGSGDVPAPLGRRNSLLHELSLHGLYGG